MENARAEAIVLIPARMASIRLPGKPLADIDGAPMIVHVWRRAVEAAVGRVVVATDDLAIAAAVELAGGEAVMTRADHLNGSARIHEALERLGATEEIVVNLQGDIPTVEPATVRAALAPLAEPEVDIATVCAEIVRDEERTNPNVVKVVGSAASLGGGGAPPPPRRGFKTPPPPRGGGGRPAGGGRPRPPPASSISPAPPRRGGRGRSITTSASTPTGGRRSTAMSRCRRRRWSCARSSSSSVPSRPACASTPPSSRRCRSASIPPPTWSAPARFCARAVRDRRLSPSRKPANPPAT